MTINNKILIIGLLFFAVTFLFTLFVMMDSNETDLPEKETLSGEAGTNQAVEGVAPKNTTAAGDMAKPGEGVAAETINGSANRVSIGTKTSIMVSGRILDEKDKPVEGVKVKRALCEEHSFYTPIDLEWKETGCTTDAEGSYSFTIPDYEFQATHLQYNHLHYLKANAQLYKAMPCYDGSFHLEDIHLAPAFMIKGLVRDSKGDPVEGCAVGTSRIPWEVPDTWRKTRYAVTDQDGLFVLSHRRSAETRVTAYKKDSGAGWSEKVQPDRGRDIPEVVITLNKCLPVSGRVLNADASPAKGVKLDARGQFIDFEIYQDTTTDDNGSFSFAPLPDTLYSIKAHRMRKPGEMGWKAGRLLLAEKVAIGAKSLEFFLPIGSRVLIHLTNEDGDPVLETPKASLMIKTVTDHGISYGGSGWSEKVKSPAPGTFELDHVAEGTFDITVHVKGFLPQEFLNVEVPAPPGMVEVSGVLEQMGKIFGKVYFADNGPAPGVAVLLENEQDDPFLPPFMKESGKQRQQRPRISFTNNGIRVRSRSRGSSYSTAFITDEQGAFSFNDVKMGKHFLFIKIKGIEVFKPTPVEVSKENLQVELTITLPPITGAIEGVVRDGNGRPLPDACVLAWDGDEMFNMIRSDGSGCYRFQGLPDGQYVVDARVITHATGVGDSGFGMSTSSLPDDGTTLDSLKAYNASIEDGDTCYLDLIVPDPWNSVVNVNITASTGQTLPKGLWTRLEELDENRERKFTETTLADLFKYKASEKKRKIGPGHVCFFDLRAGIYRLNVEWDAPDLNPANDDTVRYGFNRQSYKHSEVFTLEPSSRLDLSVHIALARIQGTVVDKASGEPVQGARVIFQQVAESNPPKPVQIKTAAEGVFEAKNLPAGNFHITVLHEQHAPFLMKNLNVQMNENRSGLQIALDPDCCALKGILKFPEASDGDNSALRQMFAWKVSPTITTLDPCDLPGSSIAEDGSFMLEGLPKGEVTLVVFRYSNKKAQKTVSLPLPEGEIVVIEVE